MEIKRLLTNICSENLQESKDFYTSIFSFEVDYDSDWFVHLVSEGRNLELGIILRDHDVVPNKAKGGISGIYLTFVVEDVSSLYKRLLDLPYEIMQPPELTSYGQMRMLVKSPEGTVCDISSPNG